MSEVKIPEDVVAHVLIRKAERPDMEWSVEMGADALHMTKQAFASMLRTLARMLDPDGV